VKVFNIFIIVVGIIFLLGAGRYDKPVSWLAPFFYVKNSADKSAEQKELMSKLESFANPKEAQPILLKFPNLLRLMRIRDNDIYQDDFVNLFLRPSDPLIIGSGIELSNRKYWQPQSKQDSVLSDPRDHAKNKPFIYTVNSLFFSQNEKSIDPELLKKSLLSVSVISNKNFNTWSTCGFILKIPENLIYFTRNNDARLVNEAIQDKNKLKDHLTLQNYTNGIVDPKTLIADTSEYAYNEIGVMGENSLGEEIEIIGIFTRKPSNKFKENLCSEQTTKLLRDYAEKISIPVIQLDY